MDCFLAICPVRNYVSNGARKTVTGGSQSFPITAPGLTANGATAPLTNV